jgi:beta-lactam-binding protein with PASTA domain/tRNA A-37 threonylcarbamoyl transferase component Bud32
MIGRKILGRYKIVERIGGGGMGVVWKANDLILDRHVALKILRPEMSEDEDFVLRFRREAKAAASLSHPNIVSIYDVGEDQGLHFIVMELVEGETLRDKLNREGRLEPEEALNIAAQICLGLAHAHNNNIIHRDIKPQNILLTELGHVKVADFGIARALGVVSTTSTDLVVGSASYLSPEQARNGQVSARSDLYSLGVVLYEMITGKLPFTGDSPVAVALQHVEARAPSVRETVPDITVEIEDLISKTLAKNPGERFQSAGEMLQSIRKARSALYRTEPEFTAKGDGAMARRGRRKRSTPTAVKVLAVFVVLGIAIAAYAIYSFYKWMAVPIVEVPDIVGMPHIEAQALIREKGLIPRLSAEKYDRNFPAGTVISQSPLGGEKVKVGREIYYTLSKGEAYVDVPDVRRLTLREAQLELENHQLQLGNVDEIQDATVPKDHVISQNPREGTSVAIGTRVDLVVSKGTEPETVIVPNLIGLTEAQASAVLNDNLLDLGDVTGVPSDEPPGTIIAQTPEEGEEVPVRTRVDITVSMGSQGAKRSHTIKIEVPDKGRPVHVRLTVTDLDGEAVRHNRNEAPGDTLTISFQYKGDFAIIKVYFDGKLAYQQRIKP